MKKFFYRVTEGDGIVSVAERFSASVTKLIKDNNLKREIEAGDMLFIETGGETYPVEPWDTMRSVARKFGVTEREIAQKNGDVPYIFYGMRIKV